VSLLARDTSPCKACRSVRVDARSSIKPTFLKQLLHSGSVCNDTRVEQPSNRYAGGIMESLNRNATDSTTTRLTPA